MPECDTRIMPATPLTKATARVNAFINGAITTANAQPHNQAKVAKVYELIGEPVTLNPRSPDFNKTKIEKFCEGLPGTMVFQPTQAQTKYAGITYGVWGPRVLSPNLSIGNVDIGLDKLGHFAQQGYTYYHIVHNQGNNIRDAEHWGRLSEAGLALQQAPPYFAIYGLKSTGVYSNGDLAANRAGYDFYKAILDGTLGTFNITNYVKPDWNEETKVCYYHEQIWHKVWAKLMTGRWRGNFVRPDGVRTNVSMQLTGATDKTVTGTYTYTDSTGTHRGNLTGNLTPFQPRPGSPVAGVYVLWSWTRGGKSGRGFWASKDTNNIASEHVMNGKWGFGSSANDGGTMVITRQ